MKFSKAASLFLGVSMFMFGLLKFFNPFKEWYRIQVQASGLGSFSYGMGIAGEIMVGILFLLVAFSAGRQSTKIIQFLKIFASAMVMAMMAMAIYVHIHPAVPAEVLPLKIKPPVIPVFFMTVALINFVLAVKQSRQ